MRTLLLVLASIVPALQPATALLGRLAVEPGACCGTEESCCIAEPAVASACCAVDEDAPKWSATCTCGGHETPAVAATVSIVVRTADSVAPRMHPPHPLWAESTTPGALPRSLRPSPEEPPPRG